MVEAKELKLNSTTEEKISNPSFSFKSTKGFKIKKKSANSLRKWLNEYVELKSILIATTSWWTTQAQDYWMHARRQDKGRGSGGRIAVACHDGFVGVRGVFVLCGS